MDPTLFAADLAAKPQSLTDLASWLSDAHPWDVLPTASRYRPGRDGLLVLTRPALAAARLRSHGIDAVAELASSDLLPAPGGDTVVIAVSAGGGSRETVGGGRALPRARHRSCCSPNSPGSDARSAGAEASSTLRAGLELGGVACRSFQHTLALLLALESRLARPVARRRRPAAAQRRARRATCWRAATTGCPRSPRCLVGPHGTHVVAPARRLSSAQQSALMLREGPRVPAYACETGDWSHVDVYLTKTTDYRLLLLAGSRWEAELLRWTAERGSTVVAVGADVQGAAMCLRYGGDEDDDVRLLSEVLVPSCSRPTSGPTRQPRSRRRRSGRSAGEDVQAYAVQPGHEAVDDDRDRDGGENEGPQNRRRGRPATARGPD